jgi:GDSL-like lipase/acylhydrolase family protein
MNRPGVALKWQKLLLLLGSTVFSLVLFEVSIRWLRPYNIPPRPLAQPESSAFEAYEPHGYRLRPNQTVSEAYPPRGPHSRMLTIASNRHGFRDSRDLDEEDQRMRILAVGDSFVFGLGVEEQERFTNLIEKMEPNWRVDNLGMNGYGPDLMLMALEHVGLKAKPDVVVVCMYTDSFDRVYPYYTSYGFSVPRFELRSSGLTKVSPPGRRIWDSLHATWRLRQLYWKVTNWEWNLHTAIMDRVVELSRRDAFQIVLVYLPGYWPAFDVDEVRRSWLLNYASTHGLPVLDLTKPLHETGPAKRVFIPGDIHWNPRGHEIAGQALHDFLRARTAASLAFFVNPRSSH